MPFSSPSFLENNWQRGNVVMQRTCPLRYCSGAEIGNWQMRSWTGDAFIANPTNANHLITPTGGSPAQRSASVKVIKLQQFTGAQPRLAREDRHLVRCDMKAELQPLSMEGHILRTYGVEKMHTKYWVAQTVPYISSNMTRKAHALCSFGALDPWVNNL